MDKPDKATLAKVMAYIGAKGGSKNTPAQQEARGKPKKGAGRPKGAKAKRGRE